MEKKIKILTLSDHPLSPSGVGTQTKYFITSLLKTGKFQFYSLAGAIKHNDYNIVKTEEHQDDWIIQPVDGYGNQDMIRSILRTWKPDILWFMTDPRFYGWLWEIENEIRSQVPMVYYHVWDNYPYPNYNKVWYDSTDTIVTISKLTSDIVQTVSPGVDEHYVPHAVPTEIFKKIDTSFINEWKKENLGISSSDDHFLIFWNSRNARRKQSGSLIYWFNDFVEELAQKHPNAFATLLMHTDPKDPNGQDLDAILQELELNKNFKNKPGVVKISNQKYDLYTMSVLYNAADVTVGLSDAEGFGLSTFESLACETPIIVTMTGGLQEQVCSLSKVTHENMLERNKNNPSIMEYEHGIGLEPASKAIIGSQHVPYIYEDRISGRDASAAFMKMYEYGSEKREKLGQAGRKHVSENYNFENFSEKWIKIMTDIYNKKGSWENRKGYQKWELIAV
jgi:glycosyltransferase involved in cell wall biosynthesis